jgi:hypothetical protein
VHSPQVINHELSFLDVLVEAVSRGWQTPAWFAQLGAFMRLEVPLVMPNALRAYADDPDVIKDYALYTDSDVLFLNDVELDKPFTRPSFFSIGPQGDRGLAENTGVMFMNVSAFAQHHQALIDYGIEQKWSTDLAYDQGLLTGYAAERTIHIPVLPDTYNWKVSPGRLKNDPMVLASWLLNDACHVCKQGYWGGSKDIDSIKIVHWHGPKPDRGISCYVKHIHDYAYACKMHVAYLPMAGAATEADGGRLYKKMLKLHTKYVGTGGRRARKQQRPRVDAGYRDDSIWGGSDGSR